MKLFVVLSLIACSYADKLDRTYLPPSSAASAGGSPGPLDAPVGPSGPAGFGQSAANSGYGQPAANSGFGQPAANSGFGQPAASGPSRNPTFGKSASRPAFGSQLSGFSPSTQYGQPGSPAGSIDPGFGVVAQNFGPQAQDYQRSQPQRAQASADQSAQILRSDSQNDGETFSYSFETSNGIAAEESGVATNGVQAQGAFSYSDDEGQNFRVTYTADENGYQPQGDHLPTPHPIPEDILKSIEKNAQAAAAGIQEGAYNPNEDSSANAPQQYNYNAPTSYSQGSSGSGSFNQQGSGPNKFYGAPNAGIARPQSGRAQDFQPLGSSQQYETPNGAGSGAPSNGYGQSQQAPSPSYGSPSNGPSGANVPSQAGPNQYQQQGPSQQYNAPRPAAGRANGFGPSTNGFAPSGSPSQTSQYQAQSGFPSAGRSQGSVQVGQAQNDNGYQYDRPQGSFGASGNKPSNQGPSGKQSFGGNQGSSGPQGFGGNQGSAGQYRPQNVGGQPASAQSSFPKPTGNTGYPTGRAQGSFGASSGPTSQGNYGSTSGSNAGAVGPSSNQGSFGPNTNSPRQGAYGAPSGQGSSFGPSGSNGQSSFAPSGTSGFGRAQGSFAGPKASMPDAGYSYNRPGSQGGVGPQGNAASQPQGGANAPGTFGAPRQPPSFSEEEGYKY